VLGHPAAGGPVGNTAIRGGTVHVRPRSIRSTGRWKLTQGAMPGAGKWLNLEIGTILVHRGLPQIWGWATETGRGERHNLRHLEDPKSRFFSAARGIMN